ncbi:MAG: hypothetical protein D6711_16980 [Chloroflexi bacterium]|nr:MAG: hypothetical protein D6711_16980 [Chloroflexota bacterium]
MWVDLLSLVLSVVGSASVLSALLPAKYRTLAPALSKIIDFIAFNVLNAKNKELAESQDDPETPNDVPKVETQKTGRKTVRGRKI